MSATRDAARTGELDAYLTPNAVARACVSRLPLGPGVAVWEPHAGGGAFVRAVADTGAGIIGTDLDPAAGYPVHDALRGPPHGLRPDWIVGNPPFNAAEEHVRMACEHARVGVAFLLRLMFWSGAGREDLYQTHPLAEQHTLVTRPAFLARLPDGTIGVPLVWDAKRGRWVKRGCDSTDYALFVWRRGHEGVTAATRLDWRGF